MARSALIRIAMVTLLGATTAGAETVSELGAIDFPTTAGPEAQQAFVRGVLLLHSFEYEDARTAFQRARELEPDFTMAAWGEAMTHNHPLWQEQDREAALEALRDLAPTPAARRALADTEREAMYLHAVEALYGEGSKSRRDEEYLDAMRRLHQAYPEDDEAKAFLALAVLGSVPERDFRTYMRAAGLLEEIFAANPNHPGAAHYLIHSYDDPIHAPLGVRAARRYARIAPAATHAQHMISHIDTALGDWDRVVVANAKAVEVSEDRLRRLGRPLTSRNKHSLLWLEYALLQQGRYGKARRKLEVMRADAEANPNAGQLFHDAAMRAHFLVALPGDEEVPGPLSLGDAGLYAAALQSFASGVAALTRDDLEAAGNQLTRLRETLAAAGPPAGEDAAGMDRSATSADDLLVADILGTQLEAILAFRGGDSGRALELVGRALGDEESRALEYGPPTVVKPSAELLGEMLLLLERPQEAMSAFERALERNTGRSQSLLGLARAAASAGATDVAQEARSRLAEEWRGDEERLAAAAQRLLGEG